MLAGEEAPAQEMSATQDGLLSGAGPLKTPVRSLREGQAVEEAEMVAVAEAAIAAYEAQQVAPAEAEDPGSETETAISEALVAPGLLEMGGASFSSASAAAVGSLNDSSDADASVASGGFDPPQPMCDRGFGELRRAAEPRQSAG